ncbi:MAG: peptidase M10 [Chitinophagaceae bacterium]
MGEAELQTKAHQLIIRANIYCYGDAASKDLTVKIADDIGRHWNAPSASVNIRHNWYHVKFDVEGFYEPDLAPETVWYNDNPRCNFFRIEEQVEGSISYVDGIGCNTGIFLLPNLLQTPTTAAHEFGHTLGLDHPRNLDIRGQKIPGIMYPRGTICDPELQYDPKATPGEKGGTLNPDYRQVLLSDIELLKLHRLSFDEQGLSAVGGFSSIYHEKHFFQG